MFKLPFLKTKYFQPRFLMVVFLVVIVGLFFAAPVDASGTISNAVATFLGWIVYGIVWALGQLLVVLMEVLVWVAQWSNFIKAPAVVLGWKIVRDICNMFFVVIMLIIAFATILRVKEYSYEKLLPKLIIMAILINFSKMICGLLIDVSQVVMLTFVNSFKDVAGANLTTILGLDKLTSMDISTATSDEAGNISSWSIMGAYVLALIYVIIALITITTMVIMLAIRIVMIWIYVVLSPMAYLMNAFPAGRDYHKQWWKDFTKNLIVGPVLAFFIWLSFAALGTGQDTVGNSGIAAAQPTNSKITSDESKPITQAGSPDNMLNFVISIAMLYGGLTIAKSVGGAAGGIASKGMGAISKGVVKPMAAGAMGAYAFSKRKAIAGGKFTGQSLKTGLGTLDRVAGAGADKIRMKMNKDGVLTKTSLAQKGLISTGAAFAFNAPRKGIDSLKNKMAGDRDVKEKLLQYNEDKKRLGKSAVLKDGSKEYKEDDKGKMREWNKEKNEWVKNGEVYKDKNGKEVSANGIFADSFNQAVRKNFGKSEDAADKNREEKVSKIQAEMLASGMSEGEMLRRLQNGSTSANEKMALAMTLAIKGGFKDAAQVSLAKKAVGINPGLSKKFNDEVDKNQAHLAYDFNNASDVTKFKKRIDTGKIDATRLPNDFWENSKAQQALEEHYDAEEFGKIIASAISRGGRKTKAAIGKGALENRRINEANKITNQAAAALHAKVTGDISESFSTTSASGEKKLDDDALDSFVESVKASDLNKTDFAKLKNLKEKGSVEEKKLIENIENRILEKLTSAKLAAMNKEGGNPEFVQHLVNLQAANGNKEGASEEEKAKKEFIWNNKELSSLLNKENLDQKKAAEEAAKKAAEEAAKKTEEKPKILDQFGNPIK